jgi:hypothetical protein
LGDHLRRGAAGRREPRSAAALSKDSIMEIRTTSKLITFRNPFMLSALDKVYPPGNYPIRIEEQPLDTISFVGWRQTGCLLGVFRDGAIEYVSVDPQELREALVRDGDQGTDPPAAPSVASRAVSRSMRRGSRS